MTDRKSHSRGGGGGPGRGYENVRGTGEVEGAEAAPAADEMIPAPGAGSMALWRCVICSCRGPWAVGSMAVWLYDWN